jgi:hypothetical protein
MLTGSVFRFVVAMTAATFLPGTVGADEALPNLSGRYRCEPQPEPCRSGQMFTVTQSGDQIEWRHHLIASSARARGRAIMRAIKQTP